MVPSISAIWRGGSPSFNAQTLAPTTNCRRPWRMMCPSARIVSRRPTRRFVQVDAQLEHSMSQQSKRTVNAREVLAAAEKLLEEATRGGASHPLTIVFMPDES